jgi:phospholipid-binding lipoprotein MlaA
LANAAVSLRRHVDQLRRAEGLAAMDSLRDHLICLGIIGAVFCSAAEAQERAPLAQPNQYDVLSQGAKDGANDPAESTNRVIFAGNRFIDDYLIKPVSGAYDAYVPHPVQDGVHNVTTNFREPRVFVNDVLQGNMERASNTAQRFAINSTVGGAGLFDVAAGWDRPHHDADFGQTLGVWGVGAGPQVQLPLLGQSNARDVVGAVVDSAADPLHYMRGGVVETVSYVKSGSAGADMVGQRAKVRPKTDAMERNSDDYYATLRLMKAQQRAKSIAEAKAGLVSKREERLAATHGTIAIIGPPTPVPENPTQPSR